MRYQRDALGNGSGHHVSLVDLFCGSGGFSLGAHQAGFDVAAAFDIDPILTSAYSTNFPNTNLQLRDIGNLTGLDIRDAAGQSVEGMFGGPPCQGFSSIGRRDSNDPRRQLVGHFFRLVSEVEPRFFVMENVAGLAYADARGVLDAALSYVEDRYHLLEPTIWNAADYGAATKRTRLFVIGIHKDHGDAFSAQALERYLTPATSVRDAIADLEGAIQLASNESAFDRWRLSDGPYSPYAAGLRSPTGTVTGHRMVVHKPDVRERFSKVEQGQLDKIGRHPRLAWSGQCPTLRAGTGADRGSYQAVRPLHPEHPRVITVREAARLQGFPDEHLFHPTVWHSFRMIGNSVSPVIARAIFSAVRDTMYPSLFNSQAAE